MDNTLRYISNLNLDIKLIIYAKLPGDVIKKGWLKERYSEIIFSYRYPEIYRKFKNIIKVNKSSGFNDYISEGPYFWKILLESETKYDKWNIPLDLQVWEPLTSNMNIISINMHCMTLFYDKFTGAYGYLNRFMDENIEICLLYDSLSYLSHRGHSKNLIEILTDILKYGNLREIRLDFDTLYNLDIGSFVLVYFLLMILPNNLIIIDDMSVFSEILDIANGYDIRDNWPIAAKYDRYILTYTKYYNHIRNVLQF